MLGAGCGTPAGSSPQQPSGPPPVAVEVVGVTRQTVADVVDLVGQLEAEESVLLKAETSGVIDGVEFQEGDEVAKGTVLYRLRDAEQRARLHEAEAQLTLAREDHARTKALAAQKTVSPSELDRATANLEAARARRDLAAVELERMTIRAPFDGVLGAREVSPGDRVNRDTVLVRIDAIDRLRLLFTVPEIAVNSMRAGSTVEIAVAPYPDRRFPGEVYFVAPTLDPTNRRLLLKAWVPNPAHMLRPGLFANIRLEVARREDALVVPESAVAYDADGVFVWRVTPAHTAERVPVELGIRQAGAVELLSGVAAGDRVVSAGTHKLAPGAVVREAAPIAAPTTARHGPAALSGAGR
jgi:membrane fusion protein (multidrug efflux system)